jgi:hypothetical protein
LPKETIDACLQHSLDSKSLTRKVGNFNLNLAATSALYVVAKNRAGILAFSFVWSKKNEHDFDRCVYR